MNHTPTPWDVQGNLITSDAEAGGAYGEIIIARCDHPIFPGTNEANAAFICRAVNSHDQLVQALEGVLRRIERLSDSGRDEADIRAFLVVSHDECRAALSAAKGGE